MRTIAPRPVVVGVHSATDVDGSVCRGCTYIHVTFSAPMLIIGEGSGVTMVGNYQLDARPLAQSTPIACGSPSCDLIRIDITPALPLDSQHVLRIANVVDRNGMGINPDPTLVTFRVERS